MTSATLCMLLSALLAQTDKPAPPPMPDFKTRVDYAAWMAEPVRGRDKPEQNAAPLYRKLFKLSDSKVVEALGFAGLRSSSPAVPPAPWDPAEHKDWEEAYQRTRGLITSYREAAARPYILLDDEFAKVSDNPDACLPMLLVPHLRPLRACAKGASENAWRRENGGVPVDPFLLACEANLNVARQLARDFIVINQLVAISIQAMVYEDLRHALKHDVFSRAQRPRVIRLLEREPPILDYWPRVVNGELASVLDMLQVPKLPTEGVDEAVAQYVRQRPEDTAGKQAAAEALRDAAVRMIALAAQPPSKQSTADVAAITSHHEIPFVRQFEFSRVWTLMRRCEASRRATRLLYELFVYRDKNQRWPASLDELPKALLESTGIDPFSGERFVYRVDGGEFRLYSVAANGVDDGGKHDKKWGEEAPDSDFVFWPIPE